MCDHTRGRHAALAVFAGAPSTPQPLAAVQPGLLTSLVGAPAAAAAGETPVPPAAARDTPAAIATDHDAGSRRRKLWDLSTQSHCPIVGVCLPMAALRAVMRKALGHALEGDEYDLHCSAVSQCANRSPIADRMQRELDQRHAASIRQAARLKDAEALLDWWQQERYGIDVGGALWAVLTHPRCRATLEDRVLRDIHMQQHQVGAAQRADARRLTELVEENAVLSRELGAVQSRTSRLIADRSALLERRTAELMQLRAVLIGKDNQIASLRQDLDELEASMPALRSRVEQARRIESQLGQIHALERELTLTRHRLQALQERRDEAAADAVAQAPGLAQSAAPASEGADTELPLAPDLLGDKSVLCVGGRPGSVPFYRFLVERSGGRFLHHDGGQEDNTARLDASLSAADVVICHTGCLSHGAYWRVKDHCKRTGTRCLFVDNPSRASLQRALAALGDETSATAAGPS